MLGESVDENVGYSVRDGSDIEGSRIVAKCREWVGGIVVCERVNYFVEVMGRGRRRKGGDVATKVLAAGTAEDSATVSIGGLVGNEVV